MHHTPEKHSSTLSEQQFHHAPRIITALKQVITVNKNPFHYTCFVFRNLAVLLVCLLFVQCSHSDTLLKSDSIPNQLPERVEIPVTLSYGVIKVKAELNGKTATFVLDNGASELLINTESLNAKDLIACDQKAYLHGLGGATEIKIAHIKTFNWHGLKRENFNIKTISMPRDKGITGYIGYDIFKDYQLTFDLEKNKIIRSAPEDTAGFGKLLDRFPFVMHDHLPVLKVNIQGQQFNMCLDGGTSSNILKKQYSKLSKIIQKKQKLHGFGGTLFVKKGIIQEAEIGKTLYHDMYFLFEDNVIDTMNINSNIKIDGLIGYEFLRQYITTIDFKAKEVRIYKRL